MHCSARHGPCGRSNSHLRSLSKCTNMPSFSKPAIYPWKLHKRGSKSIKITTQEVTGFRNLGNWDHAFSSPPETDFIQRIWLSMCWWCCAREREREREMIKLPCRPFDRPKQLQISNPALQFSTKQTNADFYSGSSRLETLLGLRQPWQVFRGFPWFL